MGADANRRMEATGITAADRAVLEFLYPDQSLSVPDIAARYNVSRQHVQVTVNALSDSGLVARSNNPLHKRSPLISLTREGRERFAEILKGDLDRVDSLFASIPEEDKEVTRRTLETLLNRLSSGESS
jgi:DNA-binding MarR family transcriptional regulator